MDSSPHLVLSLVASTHHSLHFKEKQTRAVGLSLSSDLPHLGVCLWVQLIPEHGL